MGGGGAGDSGVEAINGEEEKGSLSAVLGRAEIPTEDGDDDDDEGVVEIVGVGGGVAGVEEGDVLFLIILCQRILRMRKASACWKQRS